ncbi:MAG: dTDP-4-dehydrorhamnose reductase [Pseudomonadales bacterium]
MKILITGADGQLGRCLQDCLGSSTHHWLALNRSGLDITNSVAVAAAVSQFKPDVIVNAAAYTAVDKAESNHDRAWAINAQAVEHLAAAANATDALLIHVSTDYVFDGSATTPYSETANLSPLGVYGSSKLDGETAAAKAQRHCIVRTAWVFSEYGNNFLKTMLRVGADRDELKIVADQVGTPTYAGDLASALLSMAEKGVPTGTYHFSGGEACSWWDFANAIFECARETGTLEKSPELTPITTQEYPTPAQRPQYSVLDNSKLNKALGAHTADWRSAVRKVLNNLSV